MFKEKTIERQRYGILFYFDKLKILHESHYQYIKLDLNIRKITVSQSIDYLTYAADLYITTTLKWIYSF